MPNQTPHTPTPGFQIKPPVITKELQRLVEENKKLIKTALPVMEANERRREEERLKQSQEFIEINWIRLETENLWRPTHPDIQILQEWEEIEWGPYCWNDWDDWYYNWYAAMLESKHLWKRLPTHKELSKIFGSEDTRQLTEQEFQELIEQLNIKLVGYCNNGVPYNSGDNFCLWSSSEYDLKNSWCIDLFLDDNLIVNNYYDQFDVGFSVRCIREPEENIMEELFWPLKTNK